MKKIILTTALIVMGSPAFANININGSSNVNISGPNSSNNINVNQSNNVTIGGNDMTLGANSGHQHILQGDNNRYTNKGTYNNQSYTTNQITQDFSTTNNNSSTDNSITTNNTTNTTVIQSMGNWAEIKESQERQEQYSLMGAAPAALPFQDRGTSVGLGMMQGSFDPIPVIGLQTTHGSVRSRIIATPETVTAGVTFTF